MSLYGMKSLLLFLAFFGSALCDVVVPVFTSVPQQYLGYMKFADNACLEFRQFRADPSGMCEPFPHSYTNGTSQAIVFAYANNGAAINVTTYYFNGTTCEIFDRLDVKTFLLGTSCINGTTPLGFAPASSKYPYISGNPWPDAGVTIVKQVFNSTADCEGKKQPSAFRGFTASSCEAAGKNGASYLSFCNSLSSFKTASFVTSNCTGPFSKSSGNISSLPEQCYSAPQASAEVYQAVPFCVAIDGLQSIDAPKADSIVQLGANLEVRWSMASTTGNETYLVSLQNATSEAASDLIVVSLTNLPRKSTNGAITLKVPLEPSWIGPQLVRVVRVTQTYIGQGQPSVPVELEDLVVKVTLSLPTATPTTSPTAVPSAAPTTVAPTASPTAAPTTAPTTAVPSAAPTASPTKPPQLFASVNFFADSACQTPNKDHEAVILPDQYCFSLPGRPLAFYATCNRVAGNTNLSVSISQGGACTSPLATATAEVESALGIKCQSLSFSGMTIYASMSCSEVPTKTALVQYFADSTCSRGADSFTIFPQGICASGIVNANFVYSLLLVNVLIYLYICNFFYRCCRTATVVLSAL
jgi:hypothetical protein